MKYNLYDFNQQIYTKKKQKKTPRTRNNKNAKMLFEGLVR